MEELLNGYTPAEIRLLIDPKTTHIELLKLTFRDLVLRGILRLEGEGDDVDVTKGESFRPWPQKMHETVFTNMFLEITDMTVPLMKYFKAVYDESDSDRQYRIVMTAHDLKKNGLVNDSAIDRMLDHVTLTKNGKDFVKRLRSLFNDYESRIGKQLDPQRVAGIVQPLGTHFLLLANIPMAIYPTLVPLLDLSLPIEQRQLDSTSGSDGSGFDTFSSSDIDTMLDCDSSFADACTDGGGADSDSGDSSDSGCSGCGGCGGD